MWLDNGQTVTLLIHCLLAHFMDWYSIHRRKVQLLTEEQIESCHNDFSAVQTTHHSTAADALGQYNFTRKDGHKRKADAPARPLERQPNGKFVSGRRWMLQTNTNEIYKYWCNL